MTAMTLACAAWRSDPCTPLAIESAILTFSRYQNEEIALLNERIRGLEHELLEYRKVSKKKRPYGALTRYVLECLKDFGRETFDINDLHRKVSGTYPNLPKEALSQVLNRIQGVYVSVERKERGPKPRLYKRLF